VLTEQQEQATMTIRTNATAGERLAKANRRALETTITKEAALAEALEYLENTARWPSRRFRVEGSRVGSSYLLTKKRAESTQRQMGGLVVEVISERPKEAKAPRVTKSAERAIAMPACPKCSAEAGKPCRTAGAGAVREVPPHEVRVVAHEAVMAERNRALAASISSGRARTADGAAELPRSS
jgi:hypothetical protein